MRIGAGRFKGRRLPEATGARPVGGRLKTSLFSVLEADLEGARVLDLCAGVGGLGLEALSRGAAEVVLVERDAGAAAALRGWIEKAGCGDEVRVLEADALGPPTAAEPFDIVFLDPPFAIWESVVWEGGAEENPLARALQSTRPDGLLVLKLPRWLHVPEKSDRRLLVRKVVGDAAYAVFLRL